MEQISKELGAWKKMSKKHRKNKLNEKIKEQIENLNSEYRLLKEKIDANKTQINSHKEFLQQQQELTQIKLKGLRPLQPRFEFEQSQEFLDWMRKDMLKQVSNTEKQINTEISRLEKDTETMIKRIPEIGAKLKELNAGIDTAEIKIEYAG